MRVCECVIVRIRVQHGNLCALHIWNWNVATVFGLCSPSFVVYFDSKTECDGRLNIGVYVLVFALIRFFFVQFVQSPAVFKDSFVSNSDRYISAL